MPLKVRTRIGNQDNHDPGSTIELRNGDHGGHDSSDDGADQVDDQRTLPVSTDGFAFSPPSDHHAGLRQGKGGKDSQRVEIDQRVGIALEPYEQDDREQCQHANTGREGQAITAIRELVGKIAVPRQNRGEAWEVCEAGVGGKYQDEEGKSLHQIVHESEMIDKRAGRRSGSRRLDSGSKTARCRSARPGR